jgi:hypothetical protein
MAENMSSFTVVLLFEMAMTCTIPEVGKSRKGSVAARG